MINKPKILFIVDHLKGGGAERITVEVANQLSIENDVCIALMDSSNIRISVPDYIKQYQLNINPNFMKRGLWKPKKYHLNKKEICLLSNLLAEEQPDLIVLTHWYAIHLLEYLNGNIWCWVHGEIFNPEKPITTNLFRWYRETRNHYYSKKNFSKLMDGKNLILVNEDIKLLFQKYLPLSNLQVIHNGIDLSKFTNSTIQPIKKWDCIFIGRLSPEKQPHIAIQAFAQSDVKGKMAIVGDGPMYNELCELTKSLNIEHRVDFLGWQDHIQKYLEQSRILVSSSNSEGYGLVISEAMALDVPVVAFNCSEGVAFQFYSTESKRGLVNSHDIQQFIHQLNNIYHKPYQITKEHKNHLSIQRMVLEFKSLIKFKN